MVSHWPLNPESDLFPILLTVPDKTVHSPYLCHIFKNNVIQNTVIFYDYLFYQFPNIICIIVSFFLIKK